MADTQSERNATDVRSLVDRLKVERDQLELRMHLAKADIADEWQRLETSFRDFEQRARAAIGAADASRPAISTALQELGSELAQAFGRIRNALDRPHDPPR